MAESRKTDVVILMPVGPGELARCLDTLASVDHYLVEPHEVVLVDDCTSDGTYEGLLDSKRPNWHVIRASRHNGLKYLVFSVLEGVGYALHRFGAKCLLKIDTDSLLVAPGLMADAYAYMNKNPHVGIFGRFLTNADGTAKDYSSHTQRLLDAMSWRRMVTLRRPCYVRHVKRAIRHGWGLGQNIFGGGYFVRWDVLRKADESGCLRTRRWGWVPFSEDAYMTMVVASLGFLPGHFAAPDGPLCLGWKGLPFKAQTLREHGYKLVHSADSGPNTGPDPETGLTPRAYFAQIRTTEVQPRVNWPPAQVDVTPCQPLVPKVKSGEPSTLLRIRRALRKLRRLPHDGNHP